MTEKRMICPDAGTCPIASCRHKEKHDFGEDCREECSEDNGRAFCVPVAEEKNCGNCRNTDGFLCTAEVCFESSGWMPKEPTEEDDNYVRYREILDAAYAHTATGKGLERHATGEPFEDQQICQVNRWLRGSPVAGALFQVVKKTLESARLSPDKAVHELLGAINYAVAGIILLEEEIES